MKQWVEYDGKALGSFHKQRVHARGTSKIPRPWCDTDGVVVKDLDGHLQRNLLRISRIIDRGKNWFVLTVWWWWYMCWEQVMVGIASVITLSSLFSERWTAFGFRYRARRRKSMRSSIEEPETPKTFCTMLVAKISSIGHFKFMLWGEIMVCVLDFR